MPSLLDVPVVEGAVGLELQGAQGVGDALDGVALAVGPVVHGVDAPALAGALVGGAEDAVHHRVAQDQVRRGHVDARAQDLLAVAELAGAHAREEVEVLLRRAAAERAVPPRLGEGAAGPADLLGRLVVDVGQAFADQLAGPVVELLEVVGGVELALAPVEAEPADVLHLGVDELLLLARRVGVVEAQVAAPAEVGGDAEVDADRLAVAHVQIAVRLGRKAGHHAAVVAAGGGVRRHRLAQEVAGAPAVLALHRILRLSSGQGAPGDGRVLRVAEGCRCRKFRGFPPGQAVKSMKKREPWPCSTSTT